MSVPGEFMASGMPSTLTLLGASAWPELGCQLCREPQKGGVVARTPQAGTTGDTRDTNSNSRPNCS